MTSLPSIPEEVVEKLELHYKACDLAGKTKAGQHAGVWDTECRGSAYDYLTRPSLRPVLEKGKMSAFTAAGGKALVSACKRILRTYAKGQEALKKL